MAWRTGLKARAVASSRWAQRPSVSQRRLQWKPQQTLRYATDATPNASSASDAAAETAKETAKQTRGGFKRKVICTSLAVGALVGYVYATDTRASIHRYGMVPLIRWIYPDAEDAHHSGVDALKTLYKFGLNPRERGNPDSDGSLATEVTHLSGGLNLDAELLLGLRLHSREPNWNLWRT